MRSWLLLAGLGLLGCSSTTTYVKSDSALGRVVVYRNGIAYFERTAHVTDTLRLSVPADKVDDFLKSLTVVDAKTGEQPPVSYPTALPAGDKGDSGFIDMQIRLMEPGPHDLKLSYVTDSPSWKPSYRVVVGDDGKVALQAWAVVDNASGEDWQKVKLGVGSSSALSFRYDLRTVRLVQRETLRTDDLFALAPPIGSATHGGDRGGQPVFAELSDDKLAALDPGDRDEAPSMATARGASSMPSPTVQAPSGGGKAGRMAPVKEDKHARQQYGAAQAMPDSEVDRLARSLTASKKAVVIEGYAGSSDGDKTAASLARANRLRGELVRRGVAPEQVLAVGNGAQSGRGAGVRVVEAQAQAAQPPAVKAEKPAAAPDAEPIGTSHFESTRPMDVPRGTSAMVSILSTGTKGEIVYLYDAETARGNAAFPFRSVRIENPTDSTLESGPVTVFGNGKFIGEGLCEPIPARAAGFVPFALDRQVVVEHEGGERDAIGRIITVQRGVFSTEVQHTRSTKLTLTSRLRERAIVYVRHSVPAGYKLTKAPKQLERMGAAYLFRVEVEPGGKAEVAIEEATPVWKSVDIRAPGDLELVKAYVSSAAADGPLKSAVEDLLKVHREMADLEQLIRSTREQMGEYRARIDELHAQVVTLRLAKAGPALMSTLEKKLGEMNDRVSRSTLDLVGLEERLMVSRIRFQDGVSELSLQGGKG